MTRTIKKELLDLWSLTPTLASRAIGSVGDNWGQALVALLLSAALWVAVTNEQNPPKVDVFPSALTVEPVNVPAGLGLFHPLDNVRVRVSAPADSWSRLTPSSFRVMADLSRTANGMQEVPIKVESADRQIRVLEVIPPKVPVRLDVVMERSVPVRVNLLNSVPFGYSFKTPAVSPTAVTAIGPEALINQVEAAVADLQLEGAKVSISQSTQLAPRSAQGSRVEGVRLEPQTAVIDVPIEQQLHYVTVPLNPAITGNVASGYWVASVSADPSIITVVGNRESLQSISFVSTELVDVSGAISDVVRTVSPSTLPGVSLVGAQKVTVRVSIAASDGRRSFDVSPVSVGLASGGKASIGGIEVTVSGPLPLLQRTDASLITATVDLNGLAAGSYKLSPRMTLPAGLSLVKMAPDLVDVQIR